MSEHGLTPLEELPAVIASARARRAVENYLDGREELDVVHALLEAERDVIAQGTSADTASGAGAEKVT